MIGSESLTATKSDERRAFEHYLRTGRRLAVRAVSTDTEQKFNPYHDPRNGQFTFAPGGPRSLPYVIIADRRSLYRPGQGNRAAGPAGGFGMSYVPRVRDALYRPEQSSATFRPVQYRPNSRARMGSNNGPPLNDPLTLERAFPGLSKAPGGSVVALADNILDLTGSANLLTTELTKLHVSKLMQQIKLINPAYRLDMLNFPTTLEGQANLIRQLRIERAATFYRLKGETRPL